MPGNAVAAPLLAARSLGLIRGGRELFTDLSFEVRPGQLWQVDGPNGAGKTSLIRMLCGLARYGFEGEVMRSSDLLYLGHHPAVKALLTPRENLVLHPAGEASHSDREVEDALARVGLSGYEDVPSHTLSAGQHRRVNLARLFLSATPLWVLDEPFTAIDKRGVSELENRLDRHVAEGGAVVLSSHQTLNVDAQVHVLELGMEGVR